MHNRVVHNYHAEKHKVNFSGYTDDFIVTAKTDEIAEEVKELIKDFLKYRGLELSDEKTLMTHIDIGFDFLGWNFRKYNGKLLIKSSRKFIDSVTRKISDSIKVERHGPRRISSVPGIPLSLDGQITINQLFPRTYSLNLIIEFRICSGDWQKGDIPKSPGPGLPRDTGILKGHGIGCFLLKRPS